jgi:hypothetical protein
VVPLEMEAEVPPEMPWPEVESGAGVVASVEGAGVEVAEVVLGAVAPVEASSSSSSSSSEDSPWGRGFKQSR